MKPKIEGTVPCSICGEYPILQGGREQHHGRLVCPNYKNTKIQHGNLSVDTNGITMGFTRWHYENWWTEEQIKNKGIPLLVEAWNKIHTKKK